MKQFIYADNAATTRLADEALEAMLPWLLVEYANPSQPYSFSRKAKKALLEARESIAACIGTMPEDIYFTSGGTESDNWAIKGSAFAEEKKRLTITSKIEHHAVLNACNAIERLGYPVTYLRPDDQGFVSVSALQNAITENTSLVSIMLSNNEIGTIEPIADLVKVAHEHGALFHTDAVQAVGHIPVDVQALGVDMLSASAHKFNGPKGIGFLYVKKGTPLVPLMDGGAQERHMRAGTENVASVVGMATALKMNCAAMEENRKYISILENELIQGLRQSGISFIQNGAANHVPGNISLSFNGADGEALLHRLDLMGICVSTGSACDSVNTQVSHVLKAIGLDEEYARGTIRISLGKDNTLEEVNQIVKALVKVFR